MKQRFAPGLHVCKRDQRGRALPIPALKRFAEKCAFDPLTGCVVWIGGTTAGQGHSQPYGSFWDKGQRWLAHRWAGIHIHGLDLTGLQAGHTCPAGPLTLCVEHIAAETPSYNRMMQNLNPGRCVQDLYTRQYWLFVQKGIEPEPPIIERSPLGRLFDPPAWLALYMQDAEELEDAPF